MYRVYTVPVGVIGKYFAIADVRGCASVIGVLRLWILEDAVFILWKHNEIAEYKDYVPSGVFT